jgi:hypothetical protein
MIAQGIKTVPRPEYGKGVDEGYGKRAENGVFDPEQQEKYGKLYKGGPDERQLRSGPAPDGARGLAGSSGKPPRDVFRKLPF